MRGGRSLLLFKKKQKVLWFWKKLPCLCASTSWILIWYAVLRVYWRKIFPCGTLLLYVILEVFIEVPLFQETCFAPKTSWLRACNSPQFHPNIHSNIWVFANLLIYRKLIHDNVSLMFWKPIIFCLVLFWRRYKIACTSKYLH